MRLVFFGSGAFGQPSFEFLARQHTVLAVVTQPDRPAGRGSQLSPTPIAAWAADALPHVPLHRPPSVADSDVIAHLRALDADAFIVIAFGQKLGPNLLADRFAINLHASLLPRWRGAAPINAAILAEDTETGNSVITLASRMDAGLILGQSTRPIEPHVTAGELHDLLASDGPALIARVLDAHATHTLHPREQDESIVTLAPKLRREDAWVDFNALARQARSRIHALTPWPGVAISIDSAQLKILRAKSHDTHTDQSIETTPGMLLDPDRGLIACAHRSALELLEVQPAGKKPMTWQQFRLGKQSLTRGVQVASVVPPAPTTPSASP